MAEKVTTMVLKVDLQCRFCHKKIKKLLCKFPEIIDTVYNEKANTVTIKVVSCDPEKFRDKLCRKGCKIIISIEIVPPPKPPPKPDPKPDPKPPPKPDPKPDEKPDKKPIPKPPEWIPAPGFPMPPWCWTCYPGSGGWPCPCSCPCQPCFRCPAPPARPCWCGGCGHGIMPWGCSCHCTEESSQNCSIM